MFRAPRWNCGDVSHPLLLQDAAGDRTDYTNTYRQSRWDLRTSLLLKGLAMSFGILLQSDADLTQIDQDHQSWTYYKSTRVVIGEANFAIITIDPAYDYLVCVESPTPTVLRVWKGWSGVLANPNRLTIVTQGTGAEALNERFHVYYNKPIPDVSGYGLRVKNAANQIVFNSSHEYLDMIGFIDVPVPPSASTVYTPTFTNPYNDDIMFPAVDGVGGVTSNLASGGSLAFGGSMLLAKISNTQMHVSFTSPFYTQFNGKYPVKVPIFRKPLNITEELIYSIQG